MTYHTLAGTAALAPDTGHTLPFHPGGCGWRLHRLPRLRVSPEGQPEKPMKTRLPSMPKADRTGGWRKREATCPGEGRGASHSCMHRRPGMRGPQKSPANFTAPHSRLFSVNHKASRTQVKHRITAMDSTLPGLQPSVAGSPSVECLARHGCPAILSEQLGTPTPRGGRGRALGQLAGRVCVWMLATYTGQPLLRISSTFQDGSEGHGTGGPWGPGEQAAPPPCLLGLSGGWLGHVPPAVHN